MSESLFSTAWYRVETLKPRLRSHAQIHRHHYRGKLWYVLQDHASQRYHRFSPAAYQVIGLMDGRRTVHEIWELASAHLGDEAPSQDDVIQVLTQLHAVDVLQCDVPPDTAELLRRQDQHRRQRWQRQLLNPLYWRFPLFDPERLLQRLRPVARLAFSRAGALLWVLVVGMAAFLAAVHWDALTHNLIDRVLAPQNVALLWLLFPVVKILHELGHGAAAKVYGGEVHEMGVMLLVLQPLPYVDASAASAFPDKWQRIVVGAAGMLVEVFIAALALFVWLNVEPGAIRAVAYNVMFIAGVSTVLFNANPLLPYDGYYILADYLEMPNLRARSAAYLRYLGERYGFGRHEAVSEAATASERAWFVFYGIASFGYRLLVLAAIALFIASKFFILGVALALAGAVAWVLVPTARLLAYLCLSPNLRQRRPRALTVTVLLTLVTTALVGWVPLPLRTRAEGVIWIPEHAYVRARTDGFVDRLVARPGTQVRRGDVLIVCHDPQLRTRHDVLSARLQELRTHYTVQWLRNPGKAGLLKDAIGHVEKRLARVRQQLDDLIIRSPADGTFVVPQAEELPGQFVQQGTQLAYVLDLSTPTARVVVPQTDIERVRKRTRGIEVRLAERLGEPLPAEILREVPAATTRLPSMALGTQGGGDIAVDPADTQGITAIENVFQLDLALPPNAGITNRGGRVFVRFDHGWEPLSRRWYRQLRQLFLSRFQV